ncbi:aminoglycoside phosphotransferase family protein [Bizionia argentinensis JUB59]|uniref:Aminoglycoside phosphotransferase family protein n=1 Tax=Bizionia argentinensis JUB59 TaxID=1046627 RepID=G2E965_9FLAO|nr:aminoglycoside phosphotransferase family protein [Bizionia argentinensis]EGV44802.1 aminoglycoside phosphotransferase family protein [Bizionia argentinensis JUB59]
MKTELDFICGVFNIKLPLKSLETLKSGHINDTYLVTSENDDKFVIQKLNSQVFNNAKAVIANKILVCEHLRANYKKTNSPYIAVSYLKTFENNYIFHHEDGFWNVMRFIPKALTIEIAETADLAYEAGKLYGDFIGNTQTILPMSISETLKDFHSVPWRFSQFETALKQAESQRIEKATKLIAFAKQHQTEMCKLATLQADGYFPIRITHNDAKLSNILFDQNHKGLAVIDLDTVMPGLIHYDFGDSVRSICAAAAEDETDLNKIKIDLKLYEAYCKGFALKTKSILTTEEIAFLPLSVQTIIYIMGLRFLTDFLNNDSYYKTAYDTHNFDRAVNQFTLLQSVFNNLDCIHYITKTQFT